MRDTGHREIEAPSAGNRGQHHGRLPEGQDRSHEPGIHPDEWCLCRTGAVHDPRQSPQRNGERQGKGQEGRQTADHEGQYSADLLQALSGVRHRDAQYIGVCEAVWDE